MMVVDDSGNLKDTGIDDDSEDYEDGHDKIDKNTVDKKKPFLIA